MSFREIVLEVLQIPCNQYTDCEVLLSIHWVTSFTNQAPRSRNRSDFIWTSLWRLSMCRPDIQSTTLSDLPLSCLMSSCKETRSSVIVSIMFLCDSCWSACWQSLSASRMSCIKVDQELKAKASFALRCHTCWFRWYAATAWNRRILRNNRAVRVKSTSRRSEMATSEYLRSKAEYNLIISATISISDSNSCDFVVRLRQS